MSTGPKPSGIEQSLPDRTPALRSSRWLESKPALRGDQSNLQSRSLATEHVALPRHTSGFLWSRIRSLPSTSARGALTSPIFGTAPHPATRNTMTHENWVRHGHGTGARASHPHQFQGILRARTPALQSIFRAEFRSAYGVRDRGVWRARRLFSSSNRGWSPNLLLNIGSTARIHKCGSLSTKACSRYFRASSCFPRQI